jgi:integrase
MRVALERIADLVDLSVDQLKWWGIPHDHVWSIREALRKGYAPATVNQSLSALRGVWGIAHEKGLMGKELYQAVHTVPLVQTEARHPAPAPTPWQIGRLNAAASLDQDPKGLRDLAILRLVTGAGLKRSQVVALRLRDFEPKTGKLMAGSRTIKVGPEERSCLKAWIAYRGQASGALFQPMNKAGKLARRHMSGQAVAQVVAERTEQAGLGPLSPEHLRRAFLARQP